MANRWTGYIKKQKPCSNPECTTLVWKGKYCGKCYLRLHRHGDVNKVLSKRKLQYNEKFVATQTKESCWFIGWMASDGYIDEKNNRIRLEICDKEILEIISKLIEYNGTIKETKMRECHKKQPYRLQLGAKELVEDFVKIGIHQNKSKTLEMPTINPEFFYHFLRGVIEGDGSIVRIKDRTDRLFVFLNSASLKFLEQIANMVDLPHKIRELKPGVYRLVYWDNKAKELCERLYKDSEGIRLTRKYLKYKNEDEKILENVECH